jgi:autotransporter-associated beta strand protein
MTRNRQWDVCLVDAQVGEIGPDAKTATIRCGTGSLTKSGAGVLTVTGTNTYSGGTTVAAGTLQLPNPAAVGPGGIQVTGGATLSLMPAAGAGFVLNNALTGTGTVFAKMGAATDAFAFGTGTGTAFAGLAELADGRFSLSGTNTAALTKVQ